LPEGNAVRIRRTARRHGHQAGPDACSQAAGQAPRCDALNDPKHGAPLRLYRAGCIRLRAEVRQLAARSARRPCEPVLVATPWRDNLPSILCVAASAGTASRAGSCQPSAQPTLPPRWLPRSWCMLSRRWRCTRDGALNVQAARYCGSVQHMHLAAGFGKSRQLGARLAPGPAQLSPKPDISAFAVHPHPDRWFRRV